MPGAAVLRAPLRADPFHLYLGLRQGQPRGVFLDSAARGANARWSYLAAGDFPVVETRGGGDGFAALARALPRATHDPALPPFQGGFLGLLGYDLARTTERLPATARDDLGLPELWGIVVDEYLAVDAAAGEVLAVAVPRTGEGPKEAEARAAGLLERTRAGGPPLQGRPARARARSNHGAAGYQGMVEAAQAHVAAGDVYQANLSHRLTWDAAAEPLWVLERLRRRNPSPFGFFLDAGDWQLLSCSPERLLRVAGAEVETRPIAGTYPRGATPEEDEALAARLRADPKERAEHTMLVDLARNDLGRVCAWGSIRWDEFMTVERYSHVNHLVSRVTGTLRPGLGPLDAARAAFPGGTITGVPKVRAMEVIEALEGARRGFYTGSAGWFSADGGADLNIVIRTMLCKDGAFHAPVGAGIVADSDPAREWRETLHKAAAMLEAAGVEAP